MGILYTFSKNRIYGNFINKLPLVPRLIMRKQIYDYITTNYQTLIDSVEPNVEDTQTYSVCDKHGSLMSLYTKKKVNHITYKFILSFCFLNKDANEHIKELVNTITNTIFEQYKLKIERNELTSEDFNKFFSIEIDRFNYDMILYKVLNDVYSKFIKNNIDDGLTVYHNKEIGFVVDTFPLFYKNKTLSTSLIFSKEKY